MQKTGVFCRKNAKKRDFHNKNLFFYCILVFSAKGLGEFRAEFFARDPKLYNILREGAHGKNKQKIELKWRKPQVFLLRK